MEMLPQQQQRKIKDLSISFSLFFIFTKKNCNVKRSNLET
jgi:hypothetical protein